MKNNHHQKTITLMVLMLCGFLNSAFAKNIPNFIGGLQEKDIVLCHQKVLAECDTDALNSDNRSCVEGQMAKDPSCDQALAFLNLTDGLVESVTHYRDVDVVYANVLGADHSDAYFMIGHAGDFVELLGTPDLDLKSMPAYSKIVKRFPDVMLWPVVTADFDAPKQQHLKKGGEKIIFEQAMTNQCMACEKAGVARVAYEFNKQGEFVGAKIERLIPVLKKNE